MIIKPKIRGFICTTAHPKGCAQHVQEQIDYVKSQDPLTNGPKKVLVIGSSTGYGLSSRIMASFGGSEAATIGVFFEKEAEGKRTASAGWYNSVAFEQKAHEAGLYAKSINGDAFSNEIRKQTIDLIKEDLGQVDLVVYSVASPRRQDPETGEVYKSVLKPITGEVVSQDIDMGTKQLREITIPVASEEEIAHTVKVMGGEDWKLWIEALDDAGVLADNCLTMAYSYVGPEVTQSIYRQGTIGRAKDHLEATAFELTDALKKYNGRAVVSVNKALVTQSSSAIPVIPLYFVILNKIMKEKGLHEDCIHQIVRVFHDRVYGVDNIVVDEKGLVRVDDWELREDVQSEVMAIWNDLTQDNLKDVADLDGYDVDFLKLFGFGFESVDYDQDVEHSLSLPSSQVV